MRHNSGDAGLCESVHKELDGVWKFFSEKLKTFKDLRMDQVAANVRELRDSSFTSLTSLTKDVEHHLKSSKDSLGRIVAAEESLQKSMVETERKSQEISNKATVLVSHVNGYQKSLEKLSVDDAVDKVAVFSALLDELKKADPQRLLTSVKEQMGKVGPSIDGFATKMADTVNQSTAEMQSFVKAYKEQLDPGIQEGLKILKVFSEEASRVQRRLEDTDGSFKNHSETLRQVIRDEGSVIAEKCGRDLSDAKERIDDSSQRFASTVQKIQDSLKKHHEAHEQEVQYLKEDIQRRNEKMERDSREKMKEVVQSHEDRAARFIKNTEDSMKKLTEASATLQSVQDTIGQVAAKEVEVVFKKFKTEYEHFRGILDESLEPLRRLMMSGRSWYK
ncbi:unnamed protein product [Symbiodinium sp. CCMP2456]|nr:unnamed protein product [Symbiodinium sp. CCMP2456]